MNDGTNTYAWDSRNRMVSADNNAASFTYDPLGRRVGKTLLAGSTNFLYDGANPVQELSGSSVTANLLTGGLDERFLRTTATETDNYLTDALGSTVALTGTTGSSEAEYSYGPFGSMSITGSTTNSYGYTGRETDGLGINYYRARYYNPAIGRFLSEDPLGFMGGGANFYAYTGDSPVNFNDPFGLKPQGSGPPGCGGPGGIGCAPSKTGCFVKGLVAGAATALVVAAVATAAAPLVGATAVTVGLGALAVAGTASLGLTAGHDISNHNWAGVAYDAGSLIGGLATGIGAGPEVATAIDPNATPGWSPQSWWAQAFDPSKGSFGDWMGSGPTYASAGVSTGAGGWLSSLFGAGCH